MTTTPSKEDIERIEAILREDIAWAVRTPGVGWDPAYGAHLSEDGEWRKADASRFWDREVRCGVCAIGAHVMHRKVQPLATLLPWDSDCWTSAAASLGVDEDWIGDLYSAVGMDDEDVEVEGLRRDRGRPLAPPPPVRGRGRGPVRGREGGPAMTRFWVVWCPERGYPACKHPTEADARREAERLAVLRPGLAFHVLGLVDTCKKVEVQWASKADDGVPF